MCQGVIAYRSTVTGGRASRNASTCARNSSVEALFGSTGAPMLTRIGATEYLPSFGSTSAVPVNATGTTGTPQSRANARRRN